MSLISCLWVTKNKPEFFSQAIDDFKKQTYTDKELVLVTDEKNPYLCDLQKYTCDNIRVVTAPHASPIGKLRAISVENAKGEYVATWDDDDTHHKDRLFAQHHYIKKRNAEACYLKRVLMHDMMTGEKGISKNTNGCCNTMLALKETLPEYNHSTRICEDMPIRAYHMENKKAVVVNEPQLYIYRLHNVNTVSLERGRDYHRRLIDVVI